MTRANRRAISRSRFAVVVAAFVALVVAGVPELVVQVVTGEVVACTTECEESDGQKHCPPNCPHGLCAKTSPSLPMPLACPPVAANPNPAQVVSRAIKLCAPQVDACLSRETNDEVFHPPRA